MVAIITGDIIKSSKVDPKIWLKALKRALNKVGKSPLIWQIYRGDSFQLLIENPFDALYYAINIKAVIKQISPLDMRMSVGIGTKDFDTTKITECNGTAFENSGDRFENLKKENLNLAIKSPWDDFDLDMNLYLKLALTIMDNWTENAAGIMKLSLENPDLSQRQLGDILKLKQNSISKRLKRAYQTEIKEVMEMYVYKLKQYL